MISSQRIRTAVWLLLAAGCASEPPTDPGPNPNPTVRLRVTLERTGTGSDADGATVELINRTSGAQQAQTVPLGQSVTWESLPAGDYTVGLSNLATHCAAYQATVDVTLTTGTSDITLTADCAGQFAYMRWYDNTRSDVHYLDEHGMDHLLSQGGFDIPRDWSVDGQYLLVERWIEDRCETYRVDLNGDAQRVLDDSTSASNGRWSPAGGLIAVQYGPCVGQVLNNVVLADAATLSPVDTVPGNWIDAHPIWSPDGGEVAFVRIPDSIYIYTLASRLLAGLTRLPRPGDFPLWSPEGQHIALILFDPQQVLAVDRANATQDILTGDSLIAVGGSMAWLTDGRTILFSGVRANNERLYTVSVDDRMTRNFSDELADGSAPTVSARSEVLLVGRPDGRSEIFLSGANGTGVRKILTREQHLLGPVWRAGIGGSSPFAPAGSVHHRAFVRAYHGDPR